MWQKAKGNIRHDLAVEIISLSNMEEIIWTFLSSVQYTLKFIAKGLYKSLHWEEWGQLERGVLGMRVPLCGLRALAILKATLYFTAEKVHFKLERKIIAFFKSMCCPSSRIQENFKHCYNPLREKWKWGYLIILNKCLASFAVMDILSWLPHMRHIFRDGQSDHLFNHRSLGGR